MSGKAVAQDLDPAGDCHGHGILAGTDVGSCRKVWDEAIGNAGNHACQSKDEGRLGAVDLAGDPACPFFNIESRLQGRSELAGKDEDQDVACDKAGITGKECLPPAINHTGNDMDDHAGEEDGNNLQDC